MTMATEIDMNADFITELTAKVPKRALAIFAHPDDAEFTCGGTIALLVKLGWNVDVLVTTSGNKGTKDTSVTPQYLAGEREEEQRRASAILGANEPVFLGFPDGYIAPDNELRGLIVRHIRLTRPELVITWDGFRPGFNHRDHRYTGQATYDAIYPAADDHLYYPLDKEEELEPHRPVAMLLAGPGEPNYHVDIEPVMRTKVRAIMAHTSQMRGRSEVEMLATFKQRAAEARQNGQEGPALRESFVKVLLRR
ncbi:MAG: PIG-L family deacetylase [Dehalococcoidia bacterium]|nr:MAG: PIG-L family deacetylase [Dehalococcoidia bacterium]